MAESTVYPLNGLSTSAQIGEITMYHGDISIFPTATHALCDGQNNTPDLRGQFVRGWSDAVGQEYSGSPARRNDYQAQEIQSHNHGVQRDLIGSTGSTNDVTAANEGISDFNPAATTNTGGVETRPKNYALAYIMRVA